MKGRLVKCATVLPGSTLLEFSRDQLEFHTFCIRRCLQTYLLVIHTYIHFKEDISFLWKLPVSPNQYFLCKYGITLHMELGLCFYCFYAIISIIFSHSCSEWKPEIMYLKLKCFHNWHFKWAYTKVQKVLLTFSLTKFYVGSPLSIALTLYTYLECTKA